MDGPDIWVKEKGEWVSEWASVFCNKPPCIASQPFLNIYSLLRFASSQSIYIYWLYLCALFSIFLSLSFPFLYLFLFNFLAHRLWSVYADEVFFFVFCFSVFLFFRFLSSPDKENRETGEKKKIQLSPLQTKNGRKVVNINPHLSKILDEPIQHCRHNFPEEMTIRIHLWNRDVILTAKIAGWKIRLVFSLTDLYLIEKDESY